MAKKTKIPKRIGGVKLPKELRKAGNALIEKAQISQGREVMVGALAMAATAATAAMARRAVPPTPPPAPETPPQGTQTAPDPQAIADALTGAAEQVLGRLFGKRA